MKIMLVHAMVVGETARVTPRMQRLLERTAYMHPGSAAGLLWD